MVEVSIGQKRSTFFDSSLAPWVVCLSASLFFFYIFIQMNIFNVLAPSLFKAFHMNAAQMANLSQNYFYADVLFLFPAGMLLDRFSTRLIILLAMCVCVAATAVFSISHSLLIDDVCRFLIGLSGAFCLLSAVRLVSRWFTADKMAFVVGLVVTIAMLGGMIAQTPTSLVIRHLGWRHALMADAVLGIVLIMIIAACVRDYPPAMVDKINQQQSHLQGLGFWRAIRLTVLNMNNWLAGLYASLMNLPIMVLGALWGGMYLQQVYHFTSASSASITMMLFVGMIVGCPLFGKASDRMGKRKPLMYLGAVVSLVIVFAIMYVPHLSYVLLMVLFFSLGFFISSQVIAYPVVAESNPESLTGTAEGLASVLIMAGGFTQAIFALLLNSRWDNALVKDVPVYSSSAYHVAFMVLPIAFIVSLGLVFFLKETHCKCFSE